MSTRARAMAAFLAAEALTAILALAYGFDPFSPATWQRYDSAYYLEIASTGFNLGSCPPGSGYPPTTWCGNAGWFPGFSWLIALAHAAGVRSDVAGLVLVAACFAGVLYLISSMAAPRPALAMALACVFPGSIYFHAFFPIAPLLFCSLAALHASSRGQWPIAAAFSFLAATMYPTGAVVGLAIFIAQRDRKALAVVASAALGLGLVFWQMHHDTGAWDAYQRIHARYGQSLHSPFDTLGARLKPLVNVRYRTEKGVWTAAQTLLVTVLVLRVLAKARELWREGGRPRLLLTYTVLTWTVPLFAGGETALYRPEALLLPIAVILPRMRRRTAAAIFAAFLFLFIGMERLFLKSILV